MKENRLSISNRWLLGYLFLLLIHLVAIVAGYDLLRFVSKPLLMVWLLLYFAAIIPAGFPNRRAVFLALGFSWLGDVFLMQKGSTYFMAGLASFLAAHLFYASVFWKLSQQRPNGKWKTGWLLGIGLYIAVFYGWLYTHLPAGLKIPVLLYSLAIGGMLLLAAHIRPVLKANAPRLLLLGALLFVISDSLLAINTFIQPFQIANVAIMASYGLAQLLIIHSIARLS